MVIFFIIPIRKLKHSLAMVSFYNEEKRGKRRFISVISNDNWYYLNQLLITNEKNTFITSFVFDFSG